MTPPIRKRRLSQDPPPVDVDDDDDDSGSGDFDPFVENLAEFETDEVAGAGPQTQASLLRGGDEGSLDDEDMWVGEASGLALVRELLEVTEDVPAPTSFDRFCNVEAAARSLLETLVFPNTDSIPIQESVALVVNAIGGNSAVANENNYNAVFTTLQGLVARFLSITTTMVDRMKRAVAGEIDGVGLDDVIDAVGAGDFSEVEEKISNANGLLRLIKGRLCFLSRVVEGCTALGITPSLVDGGIITTDDLFSGESGGGGSGDANGVSLGSGEDGDRKMTPEARLHHCIQQLEKTLTMMRARKMEGKLFFPKYVRFTDDHGNTRNIHTMVWEGKGPSGNPEEVGSFIADTFYSSVFKGNVVEETQLNLLAQKERVSQIFRELFNHEKQGGPGCFIPSPLPGIGLYRPLLYCFSFRDGVLLAKNHRLQFLTYYEAEKAGLQSVKFFNTDLRPKLDCIEQGGTLPTPCLMQILNAQKLCPKRKRILLAFMFARPLFPPKSYAEGLGDDYDLFVALRGGGGVGKSTLSSCLQEIVGPSNVAILEGKTSEGHQLHELLRPGTQRFYPVCIAQDIDSPSWSQEMIQKLASGERVSINPKGRDPVVGTGPKMIVVTNGSLRMSDQGGQISRRLYCEIFPYRLEERGIQPNPAFQRRICSSEDDGELCNILLMSLKYYFDIVTSLGREKDQNFYFRQQGLVEVYTKNSIAMIGGMNLDKRQEDKGLGYLVDFFDALLEGRDVRPPDSQCFPGCNLKLSLGGKRNVEMPKSILLQMVSEYIALRSQREYLLDELSHNELNKCLITFKVKIAQKKSFTYVVGEGGHEAYVDCFAVEGISLYDGSVDIFKTAANSQLPESPALSPLSLPPATPMASLPSQAIASSQSDLQSRVVILVRGQEDDPPTMLTIAQDNWFSATAAAFMKSFKSAPLCSTIGSSFHRDVKRYWEDDLFDADDHDAIEDLGLTAVVKVII